MKKLRLLIILLIPLLLITGCGNADSRLEKAVKKTSISQKGLKSYRCKVGINSNDKNINYIILNEGNKNYSISVSTDDYSYTYRKGEGYKVMEVEPDEYKKSYKYEDTDRYLNVLKNVSDVRVKDEKINDISYKKYEFKVSKNDINSLISPYNIKVKKDGKGYVYVDKDNHVYIINYVSGDVSVNVSYTSYNEIK